METLDLESHWFTFLVVGVAVLAVIAVYAFPLVTFTSLQRLVGENRLLIPHIIALFPCSMWWYCSHLERKFVEESMYGVGVVLNLMYIILYMVPIIKANKVFAVIIMGLLLTLGVIIIKEAYSLQTLRFAGLQWLALLSEIVASATPLIYNMCTSCESKEVEQHMSVANSYLMTICGLIGFVAGAIGQHMRIALACFKEAWILLEGCGAPIRESKDEDEPKKHAKVAKDTCPVGWILTCDRTTL